MRIDGPRNLESTAALSGSFSGSFRGAVSNSTPSANLTGSFSGSFQGSANLTGSFSGSFSGSATGSFFGTFDGDGSDLTFVFKTLQSYDGNQFDATDTGVLLITSQSGQGLRTTVQTSDNGDPEIFYELVDIPNDRLANNTISGVELGNNLNNLSAGNGISITGNYNGSANQTIKLDVSGLTQQNPSLTQDFLIYQDASATSTTVKKVRMDNFVANIAGSGLTATNGVLSTSDTTISDVQSIFNTSLKIGYNSSTNIDFSTDGQIDIKFAGVTQLQITDTVTNSYNNINMNGNNIFNLGSITATQGAFEGIAGRWQGTGTSLPSTVGERIKGIPFAFTCERTAGSWEIGEYMAFGNGAGQSPTSYHGPAMPYDGKVLAATLSWDRAIQFSAGVTGFDELRATLHVNGTSEGFGTAQGAFIIDSDDGGAAGYKILSNVSSVTFSAGDVLNYKLVNADASNGSENTNPLTPVFVVTFWVLFE